MNMKAGLLTASNEVLKDLIENLPDISINHYRSPENLKAGDYNLLIIDINIFESDDLIQFYLSKYRKKIQNLPVLLVLRVNNLDQILSEWFYDDFILYPFRKGEISVRINGLLKNLVQDDNIITGGNLIINLGEYSVYLNDKKIELTYKEFEILRLLMQNKGVVFSRKDLLSTIWGIEYIGGTRTVDVHIRRLRGKLGDEFNSLIETVRNVGYKCIED